MATTVANLGSDAVYYSSVLFAPKLVKVLRAGVPGPSVWRNPGHPIITTLAEVREHVEPDLSGDFFWGREALVRDNLYEPFIFSNDVQRFQFSAEVNASAKRPRVLYMTVADVADVDRTGVGFTFNEAHRTISFSPANNNRLITFEITTTDALLTITIDSGTMPGMPGAPNHPVADGLAIRFPCAKIV